VIDRWAQVEVSIARPFAVGRFAVTRAEFALFAAETKLETDGGCTEATGNEFKLYADLSWRSVSFTQDDLHPVVCIN
jgi:formylglycine-generating enzyme required for sulfatase activity